jgi:hypothetical protein
MKGQIGVRNAEWTIVTSVSQLSSYLRNPYAHAQFRWMHGLGGSCLYDAPRLVVAQRTLERLCGATVPSLAKRSYVML